MTLPWFAPHTPRDWQAAAWEPIAAALRAGGGPVLSACTGSGKSVLQRAVIAWVLSSDRPGIVVLDVPSKALVRQMVATLEESPHLRGRVGQWYGGRKRIGPVTVSCRASLRTLADRLAETETPVRLLMVDECHLQPDRVRAFVDAVQPARRLGVTATPYRSAPSDSLDLWDEVVVRYTMAQAIQDGVLCRFQVIEHEVGAVELDELCVAMLAEHAAGKPAIVDADDIDSADAFAAYLTERGIKAKSVHSRMKDNDRDAVRDELRDGTIAVVVHVSTLVEGIDWPWLEVLCLRRDTGARVRLVQQVGRGLRTHPGKTLCTILDPHRLMASIGLTHPDKVGAVEDAIADELEGREVIPKPEDGPIKAKDVIWILGRPRIYGWVSLCYDMAANAGIVPPLTQGERDSATTDASLRQLRALEERVGGGKRIWLPDPLSLVARQVCTEVAAQVYPPRGVAGMLLDMMAAGGRRAFDGHAKSGSWATDWPAPIPPLPEGYELRR